MRKTIGIVSAFYPDILDFAKNINTYLHYLDKLIIWENTPKIDSKIDEIFQLVNSKNIEIRGTGHNEGLAKPFNEAVRWAQQNEFDFLLTMDQDSYFSDNEFYKYIKLIENDYNTTVAIYAPNRNIISNSTSIFTEVRTAISSGAVYPVKIFNEIGLFNEDFFIYMIDIEFCFKAKRNNFKTVCVTPITLLHKEGYAEKTKLGLLINNYSAQSTYYIVRNTILTWKLYPEYTNSSDKVNFYQYKIIYRLIKIVFEKQRFQKYKAIFLGIIHGFNSKTGQYDLC
ncbi:MAG: glycosyltransferase [Paludibacter sp.]|nr:glycosyltransferase [Paludibacter sp.]